MLIIQCDEFLELKAIQWALKCLQVSWEIMYCRLTEYMALETTQVKCNKKEKILYELFEMKKITEGLN